MDAQHSPISHPLPQCPACGATYASGSRFCAQDGRALELAAAAVAVSRAHTFESAPTLAAAAAEQAGAMGARTPSMPVNRSGHPLLLAGRYLQVRSLGDGGQGDVSLVQDIQTGRMLALKRFRGDMDVARCRTEIDAAARIEDHSHIVKIHELHRDPDGHHHYITMEYFEGETLESRVERAPQVSLLEAVSILSQVSCWRRPG